MGTTREVPRWQGCGLQGMDLQSSHEYYYRKYHLGKRDIPLALHQKLTEAPRRIRRAYYLGQMRENGHSKTRF